MDEELIIKLKQAGTRVIFYAIESASPRIQNVVKKNLDLDKARYITMQTIKQGIITCGYFMLGFPGETKEEMLQSLRFAKEAGFHLVDFFFLIPQPNTEIFEALNRKCVELNKFGIHYYHKISMNASLLSDLELKKMGMRLFREFYLRPHQMWRIWNIIPNKAKILEKAFMVVLHSIPLLTDIKHHEKYS